MPTTTRHVTEIRSIRASFLVFGPLLAREGYAEVYKPKGCDIEKGGRKVDFHINAMKEIMGEEDIDETDDFVKMETSGLKPGVISITFEKSSVGATETAMMAASLREGTSLNSTTDYKLKY